MKRCWKKAIAFGLALAMLASCVVVSAEETKNSEVTVIEKAVFDEAISFSTGILLLENGHWNEMTADTNLIFYDKNGNKKVISNKGTDGKKLYDSVKPVLTEVEGMEHVEAIKNGLKVYFSPSGELIGEEGQFYKDIQLQKDFALLSKDGVNYALAGVENAKEIDGENLFNWFVCGDLLKIQTYSRIVIAKKDGTIIKEFPVQDTVESTVNLFVNGAFSVNADGTYKLYNPNYEELISLDAGLRVLGSYNNDELLLMDGWGDGTIKLISSETGEKLFECANTRHPERGKDWFVADDLEGNTFIYYLNGNIVNLKDYVQKAASAEGFIDYEHEVTCENGYIIITVKGYNKEYYIANYIYGIEDIGTDVEGIRVTNKVMKIYPEKNVIITSCKDKECVGDIYSFDGKLIKNLYKETGIEYGIESSVKRNWPGILDVLYFCDANNKYASSILNIKGELTGKYKNAYNSGEILVGDSGKGEIEVVNYYGEIIHKEPGEIQFAGIINSEKVEKIYGLNKNHYFGIVYKDGSCKLFDYSGNVLEGLEGYSGIGPSLKFSGEYRKYDYTDLSGGLCVTRKTDANGNHSYGIVKLPVSETEIEPTTPPTATPVPTPEPDYETGDIDASGSIDAKDALSVLKHAAKISTLSEKQLVAADVDQSGNVNATDALNILKYAAKIIVRFVFGSEDNIRVLKSYIKDNGVVDESGNKKILMDYVAMGDSDAIVEYDSFEYDEESGHIIYVYERQHEYPENCMKFTITFMNTQYTNIKIEWKDVVGSDVLELECDSNIYNNRLTLDTDFGKDLTDKYLDSIAPDYSGHKKDIWESEAKEIYNALVHSAFVSMEDYFSKTLIMYLPNIYESYKYNDEKLEKIQFPAHGVNLEIHNNIQTLKEVLDAKGTKDDGYAFFKESFEGNSEFGTDYYDVYVENNLEFDDVYYVLDMYHANTDTPVFVYIEPYTNRNVFVGVIIYKANSNGEYEESKEFEMMTTSMDMSASATYDFECVYPEGSSITESEQKLLDYDVNLLLESVNKILKQKTSLRLKSFGFINY